jgi:hypothetical protein
MTAAVTQHKIIFIILDDQIFVNSECTDILFEPYVNLRDVQQQLLRRAFPCEENPQGHVLIYQERSNNAVENVETLCSGSTLRVVIEIA